MSEAALAVTRITARAAMRVIYLVYHFGRGDVAEGHQLLPARDTGNTLPPVGATQPALRRLARRLGLA